MEQSLYREVFAFSRSLDFPATGPALSATGHKAQKIRVTGYLMWYDDHNGSADFGSTIQYFGTNGFHHPWRSTAWEIHPIIKVGVVE